MGGLKMWQVITTFAVALGAAAGFLAAQTSEIRETPPVIPEAIEAQGQLKPFREVRLASRAQGVIREIKEEGSEVNEGDTVMQLEDNLERLQVQQQQDILNMRAFEGKMGETLNKSEAISKQEAMEKSVNHEVAKIQLSQAVELLDRRRVVAPFHGFVTERLRGVGEAVDEFIPVLTMVDLSQLYFEAYIPANQVRFVDEGQPVEIRIDNFPEKIFHGIVALKSPVVNPASLEFKVKILVNNADLQLSSGLAGTCRILPKTPKNK
jgi:membrane fusion protein, multidrug efflux system